MSDMIKVHADNPRGYMMVDKAEYDANKGKYEVIENKGGEGVTNAIPGVGTDGRNPSGTFSEPTPTDVRYPNKDMTEFENNHGAFIGKSAAQMRATADLPDAPGGIHPVEGMKVVEKDGHRHVVSNDVVLTSSMSETQAKQFDVMTDVEKAAFVSANMPEKGSNTAPPLGKKAAAAVAAAPKAPPAPAEPQRPKV